MKQSRQRGTSSDYVRYETVLDHPRSELWELLSRPELYPRFFRGLSVCTKIPPANPDKTTEYTVRVTRAGYGATDLRLRTVTRRKHEKFVLAPVPESGKWISVTLSDARPGRTKVAFVMSTPIGLPAEFTPRKSVLRSWVQQGLDRVSHYLGRVPDQAVTHPQDGSTRVNIARTLVTSGILKPTRPNVGIRQLNQLNRWGFNLVGGYAQASARDPHVPALIDEHQPRTFAETWQRAQLLAAGLIDRGVSPRTTVAVMARNHSAMVECMTACGIIGATLILLNTGLSSRQIEDIADAHELHTLFVDDEFAPLVQYLPETVDQISTTPGGTATRRETTDEIIDSTPERTLTPPKQQGRLVVLTSGTGGTPKGAKRPAAKGWSTIAAILSRLPLRTGERMMIAAPIFHSWGLATLQLSTPLRATVILQDRFDAEECLRAISQHRATTLIAVPIMLQRILNLPAEVRDKYDTSSLRIAASSGSVLPGPLVTGFMDAFGDILYNFYGSTEVSQATVATPEDLRAAPTTAGYPALGTQIAILDQDGLRVPRGSVGRIFVGNEMLFDGYTDGNSAEVKDTFMDTGDLGYVDADGRLFVSGRDDEMIISGGENVFPRPVEEALAALPQVSEVAVVGVPDDEYGQRLAAFIVPRTGSRLDPAMVRSYIHHRLSRFSVPRDVTFLTRLPRNTTGKILKRLLVERSGRPPELTA
ncbi:AMP-binding protein [Haloechinothrix salitolerans]|uniref:AMP-binding protein n=1 Tax=Haloechinothrix salitolerans TaxID=926830 RepID=A0ABW2C2J9_9PSEU